MKCVTEDRATPSRAVCRPVAYNGLAANNASNTFTQKDKDLLFVSDTLSGRVIATLRHPNLGVWTGVPEDLTTLDGKDIPGIEFYSAVIPEIYTLWGFSGGFPNTVGGAFSRDSSRLAAWSWDNIIYMWDLQTQSLLCKLKGHRDSVRSVSFSPDMKRVISSSSDGTVRFWQTDSGRETEKIPIPGPGVLAHSPDGSRLAVGTDSGDVLLLNIQRENSSKRLSGHKGKITSVAFSPDSTRLATASADDPFLRLWDISSGHQLTTFAGHTMGVSCVAFNSDGSKIASGSRDNTVRIWNAETALSVLKPQGRGQVTTVGLTEDGGTVFSASADGTVRIWDTNKSKAMRVPDFDSIVNPLAIAMSPYKERLAISSRIPSPSGVASKIVFRVIDVISGKDVFVVDHRMEDGLPMRLKLTSDAGRLAVVSLNIASKRAVIRLWETGSGREVASCTIEKRDASGIGPVALGPFGELLAMGVGDTGFRTPAPLTRDILVLDARKPQEVLSIPVENGNPTPVAFFPDGKRLAFASGSMVHIRDLRANKETATMEVPNKNVVSIAFTTDGSRVVLGANGTENTDGSIHIGDISRGELLLKIPVPSYLTSLAVSGNGTSIAAGTVASKIHTPSELLDDVPVSPYGTPLTFQTAIIPVPVQTLLQSPAEPVSGLTDDMPLRSAVYVWYSEHPGGH